MVFKHGPCAALSMLLLPLASMCDALLQPTFRCALIAPWLAAKLPFTFGRNALSSRS